MSETATQDGIARSISDAIKQEAERLAGSKSVYAVIDPDGQIFWRDTVLKDQLRDPSREELAMMAPHAPLRPTVMLKDVDRSRGASSWLTMGANLPSIRAYRPEPSVASLHPDEYPVNLVARRVRAALVRGARDSLRDEEIRGNLVLCGVAGGVEVGLEQWQQQLIGTAYAAASTAAGIMSSYRVVGPRNREADAYLPELQEGMTPESARIAAWKLTVAADTAAGVPRDQHPLPPTPSSGGRGVRWTSESLPQTRR